MWAVPFFTLPFQSSSVLDDLDRDILTLLQLDGRLSHRELARRTGSTTPTIGARIRRMEDAGIILGYTVRLDADAFGGGSPTAVDVHVKARPSCHECHARTDRPVWATIGDRRHVFCCKTCERVFRERHDRFSKEP